MFARVGNIGQLTMLRRVARDPELRRIELSFTSFAFSEYATWLAVLVYAQDQGGPNGVPGRDDRTRHPLPDEE